MTTPTAENFIARRIHLPLDPEEFRGRRWIQDALRDAKIDRIDIEMVYNLQEPKKSVVRAMIANTRKKKSDTHQDPVDLLDIKNNPLGIPKKILRRLPEFLIYYIQEPAQKHLSYYNQSGKSIWKITWRPSFKNAEILVTKPADENVKYRERLEFTDLGPYKVKDEDLIPESLTVIKLRQELVRYIGSCIRTSNPSSAASESFEKSIEALVAYRDTTMPLAWKHDDGLQVVWNQFAPDFRSFSENRYFCLGPNATIPRVGYTLAHPWRISLGKNFTLPPVGSRELAAVILERVFHYDWPVDPKHFSKIRKSPEMTGFVEDLTNRMHLALQKLVRKVHPEKKWLDICTSNTWIDTDTAMKVLRENPGLEMIASKYPAIFSLFMPHTDAEHQRKLELSEKLADRLKALGKGKKFTEEALFQTFFGSNMKTDIPKARYAKYLANLPNLKRMTEDGSQFLLHNPAILGYKGHITPGHYRQAEVLSLKTEQIPQCAIEWQWLNWNFTYNYTNDRSRRNSYFWYDRQIQKTSNQKGKSYLQKDIWTYFIDWVRQRNSELGVTNTDCLSHKLYCTYVEKVNKLVNMNNAIADFAEGLTSLNQKVESESDKRSIEMNVLGQPDRSNIHKKRSQKIMAIISGITDLPVEKRLEAVRNLKWSTHSHGLSTAMRHAMKEGISLLTPDELSDEIEILENESNDTLSGMVPSSLKWWTICRQWQILATLHPELPPIDPCLHPTDMKPLPKPLRLSKDTNENREYNYSVSWTLNAIQAPQRYYPEKPVQARERVKVLVR